MKKSILNLGKKLNKSQQQIISGGSEISDLCIAIGHTGPHCYSDVLCNCAPCSALPSTPTCALIDSKCQSPF